MAEEVLVETLDNDMAPPSASRLGPRVADAVPLARVPRAGGFDS